MSLSRKFLSAMGIESDKIDQIIEAHVDTVDALKEQVKQYKDDAAKVPELEKKITDLEAASKDGDKTYKELYEAEHTAFEAYKTDQTAKEAKAKKQEAYTALLKEAGVADKHLNAVLRVSDLDKIELDDDGKVKDSTKAVEAIKKDWSDFIVTSSTHGAKTATPPEGNGGKTLTADEAYARARFAQKYADKYGKDPNTTDGNKGGEN